MGNKFEELIKGRYPFVVSDPRGIFDPMTEQELEKWEKQEEITRKLIRRQELIYNIKELRLPILMLILVLFLSISPVENEDGIRTKTRLLPMFIPIYTGR